MITSLKLWLFQRLGLSRLNAAVGHLLLRELNLNCTLPEGAEGNRALRDAFLSLVPVLRPTVFCDIGANDGSTARAVRALAPECAVYGFEAHPRIHAQHAAEMAGLGIEWMNIAISDMDGRCPIFAPRTLTRAYQNGQVVPAHIVESEGTGKTSLLRRNEEATYEEFEVESRTLDSLFRELLAEGEEHRFFLWVDVEGAANKVIAGATDILRSTKAIFIEAENFEFWQNQLKGGDIIDALFGHGFLPLARDREYGDMQFNILFVNAHAAPALASALIDASSALRACLTPAPKQTFSGASRAALRFTSVRGWLQAEAPVLVPCFNNPSYARNMLNQLRGAGFQHVVLVDNASTSPDMRVWLETVRDEATVVSLADNLGPRHAVTDPRNFALLPRRFCLTDPDLQFNPALPGGFLGDLAALAERSRVGKVGFALDISDRELMRDELFRIGDREWKIWDWEGQFWVKPLEPLESGDPVYDANVDTTFALYDKDFFRVNDFCRALRVAGRFTARHLPWYRQSICSSHEKDIYFNTAKYSYYLSKHAPSE